MVHLIAQQQRAVVRAVVPRDPAQLGHGWIGVVQTTDQVVNDAVGGIKPQQHPSAGLGVRTHSLLPRLGRTIEVGQLVGIERKAGDLRARQFQQRDAQAAPLLQFQGLVAGIGAHHAAAAGTQPVVRLQLLLQQGQQAGQITGKAAAAKDQR